LSSGGKQRLQGLLDTMQPVSLLALLATLVLLFGFQGEQIIEQPLIIVLLAVPILIQVYFNSGLAYLLNRAPGRTHRVSAGRAGVWPDISSSQCFRVCFCSPGTDGNDSFIRAPSDNIPECPPVLVACLGRAIPLGLATRNAGRSHDLRCCSFRSDLSRRCRKHPLRFHFKKHPWASPGCLDRYVLG